MKRRPSQPTLHDTPAGPVSGVTLMRMDMARCCHWIVGNLGQGPRTLMCAAAKPFNRPYCRTHQAIAYPPPKPRWTKESLARYRKAHIGKRRRPQQVTA